MCSPPLLHREGAEVTLEIASYPRRPDLTAAPQSWGSFHV